MGCLAGCDCRADGCGIPILGHLAVRGSNRVGEGVGRRVGWDSRHRMDTNAVGPAEPGGSRPAGDGPAGRSVRGVERSAGAATGHYGAAPYRRSAHRVDYGDLGNQVRLSPASSACHYPTNPARSSRPGCGSYPGAPDRTSTGCSPKGCAHRRRGLPAITSVRAGTRNELIRSFAANAAVLVNRQWSTWSTPDWSTIPGCPRHSLPQPWSPPRPPR